MGMGERRRMRMGLICCYVLSPVDMLFLLVCYLRKYMTHLVYTMVE